jgi:2-phospho-L-lactate/phosphoenolpyruvate guanylyltransferase
MKTAAVLPIKSFPQAKSRTAFDGPVRAALAEAMYGDVLAALVQVAELDDLIVVTREESVAAAAREAGAHVVDDPDEVGHSAAALIGTRAAAERGAERVLLVPGDCPALTPGAVARLLADPRPGVVVVPDHHGTGTNALLLTPYDVIEPSFGPGSMARHVAHAIAVGAPVRVAEVASLVHDVDTADDLAELEGAGPRTREVMRVLAA